METNKKKTKNLVTLALFVALIIILAVVPFVGYIRIPILAIQATTVHIPVIVGSILLGPKYGAVLGAVFGLTSLINNTANPGITSFCFTPFIDGNFFSLIICFVPRILCGIVPHYVYKLIQSRFKDKNKPRAVSLMVSGVAGSLTNTILVMGMIYIFFGQRYAEAKNIAMEALFGVILSVVFINGTVEAIVAAIISSGGLGAIFKATKKSGDTK